MMKFGAMKLACAAAFAAFCGTALAVPDWTADADYTRIFQLQEEADHSWLIHPVYGLEATAGYAVSPDLPEVETPEFAAAVEPMQFRGLQPTQQLTLLGEADELPGPAFTVEVWLNDHVSEEIGLVLSARTPESSQAAAWAITYWSEGYSNRAMSFQLNAEDADPAFLRFANTEKDGFKEYWRHLVAVYDGGTARFYVNGEEKAAVGVSGGVDYASEALLELAGYFEEEPYMEVGNLVRRVRLHSRALEQGEIVKRFDALKDEVEQGIVYPGAFHFNAGPYLTFVDQDSASILWETNEPADFTLRWGMSLPLQHQAEIEKGDGLIREADIVGLAPDYPYFYEVTGETQDGETISSGLLSFRTASPPDQAFRFAVIGDTETRPHINQQLSRQIWNERPSFLVNLGDMTDGGFQQNKFQWNYEYFVGTMPLVNRLPVFPVPGNGEGDLYWFKRYHRLPGEESPYTFTYGDAQFFMMDSNRKGEEFVAGGRQYEWLEKELSNSDAAWKFVCFHHAPYTSEENDYGDSWREPSTMGDPETRPLEPLYEQYGVDVVMFGHLHLYERTRPMKDGKVHPEGVVYLLSGGGGGNLEDFAPSPAPFTAKTHRGHQYCMFDVTDESLTLRMYDLEGAMRDQYVMHNGTSE